MSLINCKHKNVTIHLVPHSHDDVGWLQTLEGYFYKTQTESSYPGLSKDGGVTFIITSVVDALLDNVNRRFVWSEIKYLSMWWDE